MTARQLSLRLYDELTPFDRQLFNAICAGVDSETGLARNLFDVAVRRSGLDWRYSVHRLSVLETLGYLKVWRPGPGRPLIMRPLV